MKMSGEEWRTERFISKKNEELNVLQKRNLGHEGEQTGNEGETCSC
jgi:hypothetical protein